MSAPTSTRQRRPAPHRVTLAFNNESTGLGRPASPSLRQRGDHCHRPAGARPDLRPPACHGPLAPEGRVHPAGGQ
eukprot:11193871-Lingulodinium_polyedra.AAC.1